MQAIPATPKCLGLMHHREISDSVAYQFLKTWQNKADFFEMWDLQGQK